MLRDEDQKKRWDEAAEEFMDGQRSMMVRKAMEEKIDEWRNGSDMDSEIESQIEPIRNSIDGLHEHIRMVNEKVDLMKLQLEGERNGTDIEAAKEILNHMDEGDLTKSEISSRLNYDSETVDGALALLEGLGLSELQRKDSGG